MGFGIGLGAEEYDRIYTDWDLVRRVLKYFSPYKKLMFLVIAFIFLQSIVNSLIPIISREFIEMIARSLGRNTIDPGLLRRNLVISGINLNAIRYQKVKIGEAIFELNAVCHPCSRMNQSLGDGGLVAMMGYGGFCARVIKSGLIQLDDTVTVISGD